VAIKADFTHHYPVRSYFPPERGNVGVEGYVIGFFTNQINYYDIAAWGDCGFIPPADCTPPYFVPGGSTDQAKAALNYLEPGQTRTKSFCWGELNHRQPGNPLHPTGARIFGRYLKFSGPGYPGPPPFETPIPVSP
jgi:hypothetical protein